VTSSKTVNLLDLDPEFTVADVEQYLETVYTDRVADRGTGYEYRIIFEIYVMTDKMMDVKTRNLALQATYERLCESWTQFNQTWPHPCKKDTQFLYDGTPNAKDPMRRLLVNIRYIYRRQFGGSERKKEFCEKISCGIQA
jgi:hypothetical protein